MDPTGSQPTTNDLRESYNEIPYPNHAKPFTHISRLAAVGRLRGLNPAAPENCQVLELGCADGGNLLPMAMQFPDSRFVGIDLSPVQINVGREMAVDLSADNLELRTGDILELGEETLERFDYIIVHGVYSWVSAKVRAKILSICREHLTESGLAYISYNSYPGWHGKQALRKMLQYHTRKIDDPRMKAKEALALVNALHGSEELPHDPAAILVQRLRNDLENIDDPVTYLVHEYLVDANAPFYFHEFLEQIDAFGLQYVDDAFPGSTAIDRLPPASRQMVCATFPDYAEQQQYVDFICNVSFRRSLLCHHGVPLEEKVTFEHMQPLYITGTCSRVDCDDGIARFKNDPGRVFSIQHPGLQKVLACLVDARPASISVVRLREILGDVVSDGEAAAMLDSMLRNAALEFTTHPYDCTLDVSDRPSVSKLARYQSTEGTVTNAAHRPVALVNQLECQLLALLDGAHTVPQLVSLLQQHLTPAQPLSDAQWDTIVREHLSRLASMGVLQSPESEPQSE